MLNKYDIKILKTIYKIPNIEKNQLIYLYPIKKYSTLERVSLLKKNKFIEEKQILHTNYFPPILVNQGIFNITELGLKCIQDYKLNRRENFILKYLPIIISIIALLKSFDKEIICIWQQLKLLMK
jgi:hypothetical protein